MPQREICSYCKARIEEEKDDYVVITEASGKAPRIIAHEKCAQNRPRGGTIRAVI